MLASLSTYAFPGMTEAMQTILDAVAGLPARMLVTTGPVIDPASLTVPANAEVHRYVDHDQLMPAGHARDRSRRSCHHYAGPRPRPPDGGHADAPHARPADGRRSGPASRGRPAGDQGRRPGRAAPVVAELLEDGPHRAAAARLGAAIRAMPGATGGADALEAAMTGAGAGQAR